MYYLISPIFREDVLLFVNIPLQCNNPVIHLLQRGGLFNSQSGFELGAKRNGNAKLRETCFEANNSAGHISIDNKRMS